jgi:L-seryl-tRNA(Ser) seleniumtransferase
LREVGTTNITRLSDYARAIGPETAAILRVHRSNFRIVGFTQSPELKDLVHLAHDRGIVAVDDIGSGAIRADLIPQAGDEPTAAAAISAGADLVLFSGDKLLGGPQCGIMVGTRTAIDRVESDPLMRALRIDKMTLAALEATLNLALDSERAAAQIPLWSMAAAPVDVLWRRAVEIAGTLCVRFDYHARAIETESFLGGGSAPIRPIATAGIAISPPYPGPHASEASFANALRQGDPPVIVRVQKGIVLLDMRTIPAASDADLLDALSEVCHDRGGKGTGIGPVEDGKGGSL